MASFSAKKSVTLKSVYNKKKIQFFGMNMPFISSSEAKNAYFMSGEEEKLNILYLLFILSCSLESSTDRHMVGTYGRLHRTNILSTNMHVSQTRMNFF